MGQVVFFREGGKTFAWNRSEENTAGLFFPGSSLRGVGAQQLYLPAASDKFPISPYFESYADAGVDEFTMQSLPSQMTGRAANGGPNVNISAQASQVFPPGVTVRIPPNSEVTASERTVTIGVLGALTLVAIVLLDVRGAGKTTVRIINALRPPRGSADDGSQQITVDLPAGLDATAGLTYVDLTAAVGNLQPAVEAFMRENGDRFLPLTDEDLAMVAHA